jgi:hypothetical protein
MARDLLRARVQYGNMFAGEEEWCGGVRTGMDEPTGPPHRSPQSNIERAGFRVPVRGVYRAGDVLRLPCPITGKGWRVDQAETSLAVPGSRADVELVRFIANRHDQRVKGTEDAFGQVLVADRPLDEEWALLRQTAERDQQQTRLEQWREFHLGQARSLSRTLAGMVRYHLNEAKKLDKGT